MAGNTHNGIPQEAGWRGFELIDPNALDTFMQSIPPDAGYQAEQRPKPDDLNPDDWKTALAAQINCARAQRGPDKQTVHRLGNMMILGDGKCGGYDHTPEHAELETIKAGNHKQLPNDPELISAAEAHVEARIAAIRGAVTAIHNGDTKISPDFVRQADDIIASIFDTSPRLAKLASQAAGGRFMSDLRRSVAWALRDQRDPKWPGDAEATLALIHRETRRVIQEAALAVLESTERQSPHMPDLPAASSSRDLAPDTFSQMISRLPQWALRGWQQVTARLGLRHQAAMLPDWRSQNQAENMSTLATAATDTYKPQQSLDRSPGALEALDETLGQLREIRDIRQIQRMNEDALWGALSAHYERMNPGLRDALHEVCMNNLTAQPNDHPLLDVRDDARAELINSILERLNPEIYAEYTRRVNIRAIIDHIVADIAEHGFLPQEKSGVIAQGQIVSELMTLHTLAVLVHALEQGVQGTDDPSYNRDNSTPYTAARTSDAAVTTPIPHTATPAGTQRAAPDTPRFIDIPNPNLPNTLSAENEIRQHVQALHQIVRQNLMLGISPDDADTWIHELAAQNGTTLEKIRRQARGVQRKIIEHDRNLAVQAGGMLLKTHGKGTYLTDVIALAVIANAGKLDDSWLAALIASELEQQFPRYTAPARQRGVKNGSAAAVRHPGGAVVTHVGQSSHNWQDEYGPDDPTDANWMNS